ncbi:MAG: aminotransferase class I/II-fold pyridoxal phosphate-dependent enzyme [Ilumatobacteraceae bacterium]
MHRLVGSQEQHVEADSLVLYAGTNTPNPRVSALLASPIGSRPNLGAPGDTYNRGMEDGARLSVLASDLVARAFRCRYAETRVPSGSLANLYAYLATCRPGDRVISFGDAAAGHPTHHANGAAGLLGLEIAEMPFDTERMDVDLDGLAVLARSWRPRLLIVAGSMCLFPYDVAGVRAIADEVGAYVMYDAAHMGGLIAGGRFQQPLAEGAHLMTGSTYKSLGGPAAGVVLTDDAELAERLDAIAYPGLTANFDLARTAALALAMLDTLEFGAAYADACIENAAALAEALAAREVAVFSVPGRGSSASSSSSRSSGSWFTSSQHVAVCAAPHGGDGNELARRLEPANVLTSSIGLPLADGPQGANALRLGTQELTRWGMETADMAEVAALMARVLVDGESAESVRRDVVAFRRRFTERHFIRA